MILFHQSLYIRRVTKVGKEPRNSAPHERNEGSLTLQEDIYDVYIRKTWSERNLKKQREPYKATQDRGTRSDLRSVAKERTVSERGVRSDDKTGTYMRSPNQCSLWAQRASEKMDLGTGKQGDGGMDGGRERDTTINIKSIKSDGSNRRTPAEETGLDGGRSREA